MAGDDVLEKNVAEGDASDAVVADDTADTALDLENDAAGDVLEK